MDKKMLRKDGLCTTYALACGYLNAARYGDDKQAVTMGAEGAVYFVKSRVHKALRGETLWACFDRTPSGYRAAVSLFKNLRASLRYIGRPIGYSEKNPKLYFYNRSGVYCSSSNWYRSAAHAWAHVPVNMHDRQPEYSVVKRAGRP